MKKLWWIIPVIAIPLIAYAAAAEFYCTSLYNDANYLYYYRLEGLTEAKGGTSLTNLNSMAFNPAMFNNGADSGASNTNKQLYSANQYSGQFTVSVWVKPTSFPASLGWLITAVGSSTSHITNGLIYTNPAGSPTILFARVKQSVAEDDATYVTTLSTSTFTMLTGTWDGSSMYLYVNGVQQAQASSSAGNGSSAPDATFSMYCSNPGGYFTGYSDNRTSNNCGGNVFSGEMDDLVWMSRALTATEVSGLYNGTLGSSGNCSAASSNTPPVIILNGMVRLYKGMMSIF